MEFERDHLEITGCLHTGLLEVAKDQVVDFFAGDAHSEDGMLDGGFVFRFFGRAVWVMRRAMRNKKNRGMEQWRRKTLNESGGKRRKRESDSHPL